MTDYTTTVADLLTASHRAHALYRQHSPRMAATPGANAQPQPGIPSEALAYLKQAAAARTQAALIDPNRESQAWIDEAPQFQHDDLMRFYLQQLSR